MKRLIQVNKLWWDIWPELTRNQIILAILKIIDDKTLRVRIKDLVYSRKDRLQTDLDKLDEYEIIDVNKPILGAERKVANTIVKVGGYYSIKVTSFENLFDKGNIPSKQELLIFLWLCKIYNDKHMRNHTFRIIDVLNELFSKYPKPSKFRKVFEKTIKNFYLFKYANEDVFIKNYEIKNGRIFLELDEKKRKRRANKPKY